MISAVSRDRPWYRVNVLDQAVVAERGQRVTVWVVEFNDGWIRAKDHPQAETAEERAERPADRCPAGTIWRRSIEFKAPHGTKLRCIVSSPHTERLTPVEYLTRGKHRVGRKLSESLFRVAGNYRLTRVD